MNAFLTAAAFIVLIAAAAYVIRRLNIEHADRIAVHRWAPPCPAVADAARRHPRWNRAGPSRRPPASDGTTATEAVAASRRAADAALPLTTGDQPVSGTMPRICEWRPGPMNRGIMTLPQLNIYRHDRGTRALITLAGEIDPVTEPQVRTALATRRGTPPRLTRPCDCTTRPRRPHDSSWTPAPIECSFDEPGRCRPGSNSSVASPLRQEQLPCRRTRMVNVA